MAQKSTMCFIPVAIRTETLGPPSGIEQRKTPTCDSQKEFAQRIVREYGDKVRSALRADPLQLPILQPEKTPVDKAELGKFRRAASLALDIVVHREIDRLGLIGMIRKKNRVFVNKCYGVLEMCSIYEE